ncbi:hypothetical protein R1sor_013543 [Riccia sorocarpa]|uniref:Uncharacterized protein n=1 Tax=Riccia sorocarpa TaxID=122646 RepID=A0ABD3HAQ1_9MARC
MLHLSDIELEGPCSMDETTKVVLCVALKECSDLKRVKLRAAERRVHIQFAPVDKNFVFLQDALKDTYLKEIRLSMVKISPQVFKSFAEMVGANTSVRSLNLMNVKVKGAEMSPTVLEDSWAHFFHHLRENTSIETLDLRQSEGLNDENFRDLMDLLQVNFILREVELRDTQWERDGKSALVQAALERNAKLAGYFSVLGAAQLSFDGAKAGRVFLCGITIRRNEIALVY